MQIWRSFWISCERYCRIARLLKGLMYCTRCPSYMLKQWNKLSNVAALMFGGRWRPSYCINGLYFNQASIDVLRPTMWKWYGPERCSTKLHIKVLPAAIPFDMKIPFSVRYGKADVSLDSLTSTHLRTGKRCLLDKSLENEPNLLLHFLPSLCSVLWDAQTHIGLWKKGWMWIENSLAGICHWDMKEIWHKHWSLGGLETLKQPKGRQRLRESGLLSVGSPQTVVYIPETSLNASGDNTMQILLVVMDSGWHHLGHIVVMLIEPSLLVQRYL